MPEWELRRFLERIHRRYYDYVVALLEKERSVWHLADEHGDGPGASRPGGLASKRASLDSKLKKAGLYVYATHPSQADDEEGDEYSGPRWYVTCMEAVMKHFGERGVAPMPPSETRSMLWPHADDGVRPWVTEAGFTLVPESSHAQVLHADICSSDAQNPRNKRVGRYLHFVWKADGGTVTTNVVPKGFTEGCATWDDYGKIVATRCPALVFDSEVLHRGAPTPAGIGWSTSLTVQVCSGRGWEPLNERVSWSLMQYTQPMGWEIGAAVEVLYQGSWQPGFVESRSESGVYAVSLEEHGGGADADATRVRALGVRDTDIRHRQPKEGFVVDTAYSEGESVEACVDGVWHAARVDRLNGDGSCRVIWCSERSFTDGLHVSLLRRSAADDGRAASDGRADVLPPKVAGTSGRADFPAALGRKNKRKRQDTPGQS